MPIIKPTPSKDKSKRAEILRSLVAPFPVAKGNSPFTDGYDIEAERVALKDMVEADDLDTMDPRYKRYVELERREALLKEMNSKHRSNDGAEGVVDYQEAQRVQSLGKLTDEAEDTMDLHTRDASRMFIGRAKKPGEPGYGQSGGKKVGAALRAIWYLSGNDNPYADYALIEAHSGIHKCIQDMDAKIEVMEGRLDLLLRRRGLRLSIVRADPPVNVELGFKSPYGYSVVRLISTFDYFVRVVKTMIRKDLTTDKAGYQDIYTVVKSCRSIFERVVWFHRYLMREELAQLSRSDWLPIADEAGKKRVTAAVGIFGELPRNVFNGSKVPAHGRRKLDISTEELRLLNEVPLAGDDALLIAAAESLE